MIDFLQRFSEISEKYPERAAVVDRDGERTTSYASLNDYSSRVAAYLKSLGMQKEEVVAIKLGKSMESVATEFGVMKCGCAFTPISDVMGEERIAHVLNDSRAKFVFDSSHWNKAMECEPLPKADWADSDEHDLAFIIYTSGSTGKPKGVMEEYGACRFATIGTSDQVCRDYSMDNDAIRIASSAPATFSAFTISSVAFLYEAWTYYLISDELVKQTANYMQFLEENRIDVITMTVSLLKFFSDNKKLPIKVVYVSSERVSDAYSSNFIIRNLYGSTELMSTACSFVIDKPYSNTPIGKGCSYTDMLLLDNGNVSDSEGEICLELPFFRGYLHLEAETKRAFVTIDGKRFFRTGDFARRGPDGLLYVLGRADDMVKINGNRVEPAEVESALKKVLETKIVAVKAFEKNGRYYLCAYYQKDTAVPEADIRASLKPLLPEYMIPSYFVRFEKMPLNTNGKVDKASLTPPAFSERAAPYAPPETETQKILCAAFEKVLGEHGDVGKVGLDDDFTLLGGDSIDAMNLIGECATLHLTMPLIFENRAPRAIAAALESQSSAERVSFDAREQKTLAKAALNEEQLIMIQDEIDFPGTVMFNIACKITLQDDIDMNRFARSVKNAVSAHPALLSVIEKDGESYYLRYEPDFDREIAVESMSDEDFASVEKSFVKPFLFDGSPLFRARIIKTPNQNVFLFDVYHVIADGTSINILLDDIARAFNGEAVEKDSIYQFMQKKADFKNSEAYLRDAAYFKNRYDKDDWHVLPKLDFETDESAIDNIIGDFSFSQDRVASICRLYGLGSGEFYAVAAALAIARYNGARNVMFSWVWNGREEAATRRSVGFFLKDFPIAFVIDDKTQLKDLFLQAKEQVADAFAHGSVSYFERPELYHGHEMFSLLYQKDMYSPGNSNFFKSLELLETDGFPKACDTSPELEILKGAAEYGFNLHYNAVEYKRESMERFVELFLKACDALLQATEESQMTIRDIQW